MSEAGKGTFKAGGTIMKGGSGTCSKTKLEKQDKAKLCEASAMRWNISSSAAKRMNL